MAKTKPEEEEPARMDETSDPEEAETPAEESEESPEEQAAEEETGTEPEPEPTDEEKAAAVAHYRKYKPLTDSIEAAGGLDAFGKYKEEAAQRAEESKQTEAQKKREEDHAKIGQYVAAHVEAGHLHPDLAPGFESMLKDQYDMKPIKDEMDRRNHEQEKAGLMESLRGQFPHMDEAQVHGAIEGGGDIVAVAEHTHNHAMNAIKSAMTAAKDGETKEAAAARKEKATAAPMPMKGGGEGPMPPKASPKPGTPEFEAHMKKMDNEANDRKYGK